MGAGPIHIAPSVCQVFALTRCVCAEIVVLFQSDVTQFRWKARQIRLAMIARHFSVLGRLQIEPLFAAAPNQCNFVTSPLAMQDEWVLSLWATRPFLVSSATVPTQPFSVLRRTHGANFPIRSRVAASSEPLNGLTLWHLNPCNDASLQPFAV